MLHSNMSPHTRYAMFRRLRQRLRPVPRRWVPGPVSAALFWSAVLPVAAITLGEESGRIAIPRAHLMPQFRNRRIWSFGCAESGARS